MLKNMSIQCIAIDWQGDLQVQEDVPATDFLCRLRLHTGTLGASPIFATAWRSKPGSQHHFNIRPYFFKHLLKALALLGQLLVIGLLLAL